MPRKKYSFGVKGKKTVKLAKAPRNKLPAKALRKAQKNRKRSGIELTVYDWLKELKIKFTKEKTIGRCHADVYIEPNILLEINGCYWHACYECNCKKSDKEARLIRNRDIARYAFFRSRGFEVHILWEHEILKFPEASKTKLKEIYDRKKDK